MIRISVCMATHNGEKYIAEQLDSILVQLGEDDEIIISDDGSTDTTISIIQSYRDKRLKLVTCKTKNNPVKNFENALSHSSGQFIFLSDQDDLWMPNKVKVMLQALNKYDLVLSDGYIVNEKLEPLHKTLFDIHNTGVGLLRNLWKNGYVGCCMAFKREVLKKAQPFPANVPMHDQWIGLTGELFFDPTVTKEKLTMYRRHDKNTTQTGFSSNYSFIWKIKFRATLMINLMRLYL